jgi:signal transduction histidine kinase
LLAVPLLVALFAVHLLWQASGKASMHTDHVVVYAVFLAVATVGPASFALMLQRMGRPIPAEPSARSPRWLSPTTASVLMSLGIVSTALVMYLLASESVGRSTEQRLRTVATLKRDLVQNWLDEALGDIQVSAQSPALRQALQDWRAAPGRELAQQRLQDHLWRLAKTSHYAQLGIRDGANGTLLISTSGDADTPEVRRGAVAAAAAPAPMLEDFHPDTERDHAHVLYLGAFAPLTPPDGHERFAIHASIDPRHELYALIGQTSGWGESAEVLLLRRDGDALQLLNDTDRAASGTPARRLAAASRTDLGWSIVQAGTGLAEGEDDRGHRTLAYALPVAGTPWMLVAKLDRAEAFAELERIALIAASIVGALLVFGAWWWVDFQRHLIAEQRHRAERDALSRRVVSVQEEERRRWSSELHDRTGANLATVNMNLKAIAKAIPQPGAEDAELLRETSDLLKDTVASIREFCDVLRPAMLEYGGLVPALQARIDQFARHTGIATRFDHETFTGRCSPERELMLFRIAQEALINCAKHAAARSVVVRLEGDAERPRLSIEDDGAGFDASDLGRPERPIGHGLLSMRERAAFAGGALAIDSAPGRGTRVTVSLG